MNDIVFDLDKLKIFFEANKSIKYLTFSHIIINDVDYFKKVLRLTSLLFNLIDLSFKTSYFGFNEEVLAEEVTQLALICKQLKSIECSIVLRISKFTTIRELLSPLRQFKQLRRLKINFTGDNHDNFDNSSKLFDSFEAFEGFEDLTHLTVCMLYNSDYLAFPESILKDIDINLPKLQYLCLNFTLEATKWTADILCRLTRLQTIELNIENELLGPQFVSQLQQKCKKFKSIKLNFPSLFYSNEPVLVSLSDYNEEDSDEDSSDGLYVTTSDSSSLL